MRISRVLGTVLALSLVAACNRTPPDQASLTSKSASVPTPETALAASTPSDEAPVPTIANFEFVGVAAGPDNVSVAVIDRRTDTRRWIKVGETLDGIEVLDYNLKNDEATIRVEGQSLVLSIRKEQAAPPASEDPTALSALAGATLSQAMMASYQTLAPGDAPEQFASPTEIAPPVAPLTEKEREVAEREARMMVSDLLEISQIHRRAYEEKKAAEEAAAKSATESMP